MGLPGRAAELLAGFQTEIDGRFPDRLRALFLHGSLCWGEFFSGSDLDFVAVWDRVPSEDELADLEDAHGATRAQFGQTAFDGFHCSGSDLRRSPAEIGTRPVFYEGGFAAAGSVDINVVTWHELAERPVVVRGAPPDVWTDLPTLVAFTRGNLDTYWRATLTQIEGADPTEVGAHDASVAWVVLGAARLHHLLAKQALTSKSGAGRYVVEELDRTWNQIGFEALRIRERPEHPSLYRDPADRGRDMHGLLRWIVQDGTG